MRKPAAETPPLIAFDEPDATTLAPGAADDLIAGDYRENELYDAVDLSELDLAGMSFQGCRFDRVILTEAKLRGARFLDTVFDAPFAHSLTAARTSWKNVRFLSPRWGSAELYDSELDSVHIRGGKIDFLNLRGARLTNVIIEDCTITDLDLGGAKGTRVAFVNCRIGTLDVTGATSANVDLRTSEFAAVHGVAGLSGMIIDDLQLSEFSRILAAHVGVRVE